MAGVNLPWMTGSGGVTNMTRQEAQRFARHLLESEKYREGLKTRLESGTLPAPLEAMLWHYGYGKPAESVNVSVTKGEDLSELSADELLKRSDQIRKALEEAIALETAIDAEVSKLP